MGQLQSANHSIRKTYYCNQIDFKFSLYTIARAIGKLQLIEAGFEFVSADPDGTQYFRKRK